MSCSTQNSDLNSAPWHFKSTQFEPCAWDVHLIDFHFCEDTRPEAQLAKAREQHSTLLSKLRTHHYNKVQLNTILYGVIGTTYTEYTDTPLKNLGLNYNPISKLKRKLIEHVIKQAAKLTQTRYLLHIWRTPGANLADQVELGAWRAIPPILISSICSLSWWGGAWCKHLHIPFSIIMLGVWLPASSFPFFS